MEKVFRRTMRTGVALLLASGVALTILSARRPPTPVPPIPDPENVPASSDPDVIVLTNFIYPIRGRGVIHGSRVLHNQKKKTYSFEHPEVTIYELGQDTAVTPESRKVEMSITADSAFWDANLDTVVLRNHVHAAGADARTVGGQYEINADTAVYTVLQRAIRAGSRVRVRAFDTAPDGSTVPKLDISGVDLIAEAALSRLALRRDVELVIHNVSDDLFADGGSTKAPDTPTKSSNLKIMCDGAMLYDSDASRITFKDNVHLLFGALSVVCTGTLSARVGEQTASGRVPITAVSAEGDVVLKAGTWTVKGDFLQWDDVTQAAAIKGKATVVAGPRIRLETPSDVSLLRMTDEMRVEGPGKLTLSPAPRPAEKSDEAAPAVPEAASAASAILKLQPGEQIVLTWTERMVRDAGAGFAKFDGNVTIVKATGKVRADSLRLDFDKEGRLTHARALGGVVVDAAGPAGQRQVKCHALDVDAVKQTVSMQSSPDQRLKWEFDRTTVESTHIRLNQRDMTISCLAPGKLTIGGADDEPGDRIVTEWTKSAALHRQPPAQTPPYAVFTGAVKVRRPDQLLGAETIRVDFDKDMTTPLTITASGMALMDVRVGKSDASGATLVPAAPAEAADPEAPAEPVAAAEKDSRLRVQLRAPKLVLRTEKQIVATPKGVKSPGSLTVLDADDVVSSTVKWLDSFRLDLRAGHATVRGGVLAHTPSGDLKSSAVVIEFESSNIKHISADGDVQFQGPNKDDWQVACLAAEAIFAGGELHQFIAREKILVTDGPRRLEAGTLILTFAPPAAAPDQKATLTKAIAEKDVRLTYVDEQKNTTIRAGSDKLEWTQPAADDPEQLGVYKLTGNPAWLKRGSVESQQRTISIYRKTGTDRQEP
jgi:lipopolysaccharide export system protein LptA